MSELCSQLTAHYNKYVEILYVQCEMKEVMEYKHQDVYRLSIDYKLLFESIYTYMFLLLYISGMLLLRNKN